MKVNSWNFSKSFDAQYSSTEVYHKKEMHHNPEQAVNNSVVKIVCGACKK